MASTNALSYLEDALLNPVNLMGRVYRHPLLAASFPVLNDTINFFKIPKNVKIVSAVLAGTDMDTGATLVWTLRLTDGTTTKNLVAAQDGSTAAFCTNIDEEEGLGFVTDTDDYRVEVLVATAAGTAADGTLTVSLTYTAVLDAGA